jgi:hypothetical protein
MILERVVVETCTRARSDGQLQSTTAPFGGRVYVTGHVFGEIKTSGHVHQNVVA